MPRYSEQHGSGGDGSQERFGRSWLVADPSCEAGAASPPSCTPRVAHARRRSRGRADGGRRRGTGAAEADFLWLLSGDFLLNLRAVLLPTGTVCFLASGGSVEHGPLVGKPHPRSGAPSRPRTDPPIVPSRHVLFSMRPRSLRSPSFVPGQYKVEQRADHGTESVSGSEPKDQRLVHRMGFWRRTTASRRPSTKSDPSSVASKEP